MDVVQQVLCGKVNKNLVAKLNRWAARPWACAAWTDSLFQAATSWTPSCGHGGRDRPGERHPGRQRLLDGGYIPVVVHRGPWDGRSSSAYNINADTAAAQARHCPQGAKSWHPTDRCARACCGTPRRTRPPSSPRCKLTEVAGPTSPAGIIAGGMIPKIGVLRGCHRAAACTAAIILDGRVPHSILIEMLSDKGIGTMLWE